MKSLSSTSVVDSLQKLRKQFKGTKEKAKQPSVTFVPDKEEKENNGFIANLSKRKVS